MMNAQDIKNGTCIRLDGRLYFCVEFLHVKPGKGNTFMRTKLKDVVDGRVIERRFNIGEKLEDVRVERRPATVETGATVRVPLFINEGELIEIDTRDGSYVGRVKA